MGIMSKCNKLIPSALLHFVTIQLRSMTLFYAATENFIQSVLLDIYSQSIDMSNFALYNGTLDAFNNCISGGISNAMNSFNPGFVGEGNPPCVDFSDNPVNYSIYFVWAIRFLTVVYFLVCIGLFLRAGLFCESFRSGKYLAFTYSFESANSFKATAYYVVSMAALEAIVGLVVALQFLRVGATAYLSARFGDLFALYTSANMVLMPVKKPSFDWQGDFFKSLLFNRPCWGYIPLIGQNNNDFTTNLSFSLLEFERGLPSDFESLLPAGTDLRDVADSLFSREEDSSSDDSSGKPQRCCIL